VAAVLPPVALAWEQHCWSSRCAWALFGSFLVILLPRCRRFQLTPGPCTFRQQSDQAALHGDHAVLPVAPAQSRDGDIGGQPEGRGGG
jgi:hypothetical protein